MMEITVGIDLGTTHSCIATIKQQKATTIPQQNTNLLPSYVLFEKDRYIVGDAAKNGIQNNIENTIYASKRLIGRKFNDKEVQEDIPFLSYVVEENRDGEPIIKVNNKSSPTHTPVEISSYILKELKCNAEKHLNSKIVNAVICVPAYFNDKQRNDTLKAAELACFKVLQIINEPTAAAIAYKFDRKTFLSDNNNVNENKNNYLLVYDLGGGTFDVSIIELNNDNNEIEVKGTYGDNHLGGEDFTNKLYSYVLDKYEKMREENEDEDKKYPALNKKLKSIIRARCEEGKITLSQISKVQIEIFNDISITITFAEYTEIVKDLIEKTMNITNETIKRSRIDKDSISNIILIGGCSRMPQIPDYITKEFPHASICKDISPDEAVSQGAAIVANNIIYNKIIVVKNNKNEIEIVKNSHIIPNGSEIIMNYKTGEGIKNSFVMKSSKDNSLYISTSGIIDDCSGDDVILPPMNQRPTIHDIVIHAIGVEIKDKSSLRGIMDVLINVNEKIPCFCRRKYRTYEDNQEYVKIRVLEGEDGCTENNHLLDEFEIGPIPKLPKGEYQFYIFCSIDENGMINFIAKNLKGFDLGSVRINIE